MKNVQHDLVTALTRLDAEHLAKRVNRARSRLAYRDLLRPLQRTMELIKDTHANDMLHMVHRGRKG